jgi:thiol:disulfide interchange protein DsbA
MQCKPRFLIAYTFAIIIISALITTGYFHYFVLGNSGSPENEVPALQSVSDEQVKNSPIKDKNTIVEVFSYGCHYCALNESNVKELENRMPADTRFVRIHISNEQHSGLASYASVFATLTVMGIESQHRASAYDAVIKKNIDLADKKELNDWLSANGIDVEAYAKASESAESQALMSYMTSVSRFYTLRATPTFIVGKKWLATQDRDFPEFSDHLLSLLEHDKPLEK